MENKYKVLKILNIIISVIALICSLVLLINGYVIAYGVISIIVCGLNIYYVAFGYNKAHSNLLKYIMLIYGVSLLGYVLVAILLGSFISIIIPIIMMIIGYIAGRLNRIEQNKYIITIVLVLMIIVTIGGLISCYEYLTLESVILFIIPTIEWLSISGAYFTRYLAHKKLGLEDNFNTGKVEGKTF